MRISFVGGGTDIKEYYENFGGSVFNASINKYVYILINKYHDKKKCILKYSKSENVNSVKDIKHPLIIIFFKNQMEIKNKHIKNCFFLIKNNFFLLK